MTLDQISFRLCDLKTLNTRDGKRTESMASVMAGSMLKPDEDGLVPGRAADGTPIRARVGGKSVARKLWEEQEAKRDAEKKRRKEKLRKK